MTIATATEPGVDSGDTTRIHIRYLTDRCVAARVDARERPEWPPHPGRLFMALAAAYFETDQEPHVKEDQRVALEWLSCQPAPRIHAVEAFERTAVTCYVPVNDAPLPNLAMLQSAPGMPRSRQSRAFPTVIPDHGGTAGATNADVTFEWFGSVPPGPVVTALDQLCQNVIRIGHSSSLVTAWIDRGPALESNRAWEPAEHTTELACRIAAAGELERLRKLCQADRIDLFATLKEEIDSLTGKAQNAARARFAEAFGEPYKSSLRPPEPNPATLGVWQGYRRVSRRPQGSLIHENQYFERDLIILAKKDGPVLDVERTLGLTRALRNALLQRHGQASIPSWVSGHDDDGSPTASPHAAFLALPYAGFSHADGHIMGLAIAVPRGISRRERARWLSPLLIDPETGDVAVPELALWGRDLPRWSLELEQRPSPPRTLQNSIWTDPSRCWATVTPAVLDRFPKADRGGRAAWEDEVIAIISQSCLRAGLPTPESIAVGTTAWHPGIPRAWAKSRALTGADPGATAPLGDGFPPLLIRPSRPAKPQIHVKLTFTDRVAGPVLIGAGRFAGYGLCLPLSDC